MSVQIGQQLGAYEIAALLGKGGMGEVYRARDLKLKRDVALKVLPDHFADDPDRLVRFQREAQILASLNHPNIAQIHGLEESDNTRCIVMELVEGETLQERLERGSIPLDEALAIARQIAEALESAHERGIIHRDLKPANIKVTQNGNVKVLDFGLAKAFENQPAASLSDSPTLTAMATQKGVILGTAAYMSPEQAKGREADRRADIFSYGAVLYEMLTGTRAFRGDEVTDTLAAVLRSEPQWSELPRDVPARVRQVLKLCLQKEPRQRMQAIGDVRLALDGDLGDSEAAPETPYRGWRRWTARTLAAAVLLFMGWFVGWIASRPGGAPPARTVRLSVDLPSGERLASLNAPVSLSPDGQTIVYAAVRGGVQQLYRRRLDQRVATPIPGTEGAGVSFFSPDGNTIGFIVGSRVKKVALAGGEPVEVQQLATSSIDAASWGEDGTIVLGYGAFGRSLTSIPASGGEPRVFASLDTNRGDLSHTEPAHLPGGRGLLYTTTLSRIILRSRDGKEMVLTEGRSPRFVSSGHIVFLRNESLWAMPFDLDAMAAMGDPVKVADGVVGSIAVSGDGTLAYVGGRPGGVQLVWVDARGLEQVIAGPQTAGYQDAILSPDADRIALTIVTPDRSSDIFVYHLGRQTLTQVTADRGTTLFPLWTPDGKQLVFSSSRSEVGRNLFRRAADGTGPIERLTTSPSQHSPWGWSADGKTLVIQQLNPDTSWDILGLSIGGSDQPFALVQTKSGDLSPAISPNGRLMAYQSDSQIYVSPFPNTTEFRRQVSTAGGNSPRWSRDGRTLFYRSGSGIMAAAVETSPSLSISVPKFVVRGEYLGGAGSKKWDVAPDGRFLLMKPVPAEPSVQVVLNWTEELKRLVPRTRARGPSP